MIKELKDLVGISQFYGKQSDYTLGGGGNTSYKNRNVLYIKASGHSLATITENGFAVLDRTKLKEMHRKPYNSDPQLREYEVKEDLLEARTDPDSDLRPSVETLLHDSINYDFIVHTHPHMVNGLLCSRHSESRTREMFGDEILFIQYTDPGMILSRTVLKYLKEYRKTHPSDPHLIFLQNHGVFVAADSVEEIKRFYEYIHHQLMRQVKQTVLIANRDISPSVQRKLEVLRKHLPEHNYMATRFNSLIQQFTQDLHALHRIDRPFVPDQIVYCKAYPLIIPSQKDRDLSMTEVRALFKEYYALHGYEPRVILFEDGPMAGIEENARSAELVLDVFEDAMKISFYSDYFGGPNFMSDKEIAFIENWEAENYRQSISKT